MSSVEFAAENFVLVHGKWLTPGYLRPLEEEIEKAGHRAVRPNLPATDPEATLRHEGRAIVEQTEELGDRIYVAHSGGFPAVLWAIKFHPEKAKGLIVYNSVGRYGVKPVPAYPGEPPPDRHTEEFTGGINYVKGSDRRLTFLDPCVVEACFLHDVPTRLRGLVEVREQRNPRILEQPPRWPANLPVLFVNSKDDRVMNLETARRVQQQEGVKAKEINGGHLVVLSRHKKAARVILKFAEKIAKT